MAVLRWCGSLDFWKKEKSSELNGLFRDEGVRGILEGKGSPALGVLISFIAILIDREKGPVDEAAVTKLNATYSNRIWRLSEFKWNRKSRYCMSGGVKKKNYSFLKRLWKQGLTNIATVGGIRGVSVYYITWKRSLRGWEAWRHWMGRLLRSSMCLQVCTNSYIRVKNVLKYGN